jgi:hypothetical protein
VTTGLVVGIYPESDPQALEGALTAQQIDPSKVRVVSAAVDAPSVASSSLVFVDVIADMESNSLADDMTHGTGVLDESVGTGVPGLTSGGHQANLTEFNHHEHATRRYLAGFDIPDDEVENFGDAVVDGRAVVLYPDAGADAAKIAEAFHAAGLRNVRSY